MKKHILLTLAILPLAACATDSPETLAPDSPQPSTSTSASPSASPSAEATTLAPETQSPTPEFIQEINTDQPAVEPPVEPSVYEDEFVTGVTPPDIYIPAPDATDVPNPEETNHEPES